MKNFLLILELFVLVISSAGCNNPYRARMQSLHERLDMTKVRGDRAMAAWDDVAAEEAGFVSELTDEQLAAYQSLSDVFATGSAATEQLARRQLARCFDRDDYATAITIMQNKHYARLEIDAVGRSYRALQQEGEELGQMRQRQMRAISDYMLRESIRNRGY